MPTRRPALRTLLTATTLSVVAGLIAPLAPAAATTETAETAGGTAGSAAATLTGTLTVQESGAPLRTGEVRLFANYGTDDSSSWGEVQDVPPVSTDTNGTWAMTVDPGTYRLEFIDTTGAQLTEFYEDATEVERGTSVRVGAGATVDVDAALADLGTVAGRVVGEQGEPLAGIGVQLFRNDGDATFPRFEPVGNGVETDADGRYRARIEPGTYRVRFEDPDPDPATKHATEYYRNSDTVKDGDDVLVETGTTTVDARMTTTGTVAGTVVGTDGRDLAGITVSLWARATDGQTWTRRETTTTDAAGAYEILTDPGTYRVGFSDDRAQPEYFAEFHADAQKVADGDDVTVGVNIATVDAELRRMPPPLENLAPPTVDGTTLVGRTVSALPGRWSPQPQQTQYQWYADGTAITGASGQLYQPRPADRGKRLSVAVTVRHRDHLDTTLRTTEVGPVKQEYATSALPTITVQGGGDVEVGKTLEGTRGTWDPIAPAYAYQWLADGQPIANATTSTLRLTSAQRGATVSLRVTAQERSDHYVATSATSAGVGPVVERVANSVLPSISGTAVVGQTVTAREGTWSPDGVTYTYQWRADGGVLPGATNRTLALTSAQRGKALTVDVTASKPGYVATTKTSAATSAVTETIVNRQRPTITGTPRVGSTLTAGPGTWSATPPPGGFRYQWYAGDTAVDGATGSTFVPTAAQRGAAIEVRVVAVGGQDGWLSSDPVASARTSAVLQFRTVSSSPSFTGDLVVGSTLTAVPGAFSPAVPAQDLRYAWYADDVPIPGATRPTLTLGRDQRGTRISLDVVAVQSADGWAETPSSSAERGPVTQPVTNDAAPTVTGDPLVGSTLSADPGRWTGSERFVYAWYADDEVLPGETGRTLVLTADHRGASIAVEVTAVGTDGWTDQTARSSAVGPVSEPLVVDAAPTVTGTPRVGSPLTATEGSWTPTPTGLAYQWYADGTAVDGATGSTWTPTEAHRGASVTVAVTASADDYGDTTATSAAVGPVTETVRSTSKPTIAGTPQVGKSLTASTGSWSPTPTSYRYQWYAAGTRIAGATKRTFTPVAAQLGAPLTVTVTPRGEDLVGTTATSKPTAAVTALPTVRLTSARTGTKLTLTVTVTVPGLKAVPGKVTISAARKKLGTVTLKKGRGTLTVPRPKKATTYTAAYLGSGSILKATGTTRAK